MPRSCEEFKTKEDSWPLWVATEKLHDMPSEGGVSLEMQHSARKIFWVFFYYWNYRWTIIAQRPCFCLLCYLSNIFHTFMLIKQNNLANNILKNYKVCGKPWKLKRFDSWPLRHKQNQCARIRRLVTCRLKLYRPLWCRWNKRQISNWSSVGYLKRVQFYNWFRLY